MNNLKKIENVTGLPAKERYEYFVRKVADFEVVWGLYDSGWATVEINNAEGIPFWPESVFAQVCATDAWINYRPREIPLDEFIAKWLPGMGRDGKIAAVFPTPANRGIVVSPEELALDIDEQLQQYE